jgi:hypothetical protein
MRVACGVGASAAGARLAVGPRLMSHSVCQWGFQISCAIAAGVATQAKEKCGELVKAKDGGKPVMLAKYTEIHAFPAFSARLWASTAGLRAGLNFPRKLCRKAVVTPRSPRRWMLTATSSQGPRLGGTRGGGATGHEKPLG